MQQSTTEREVVIQAQDIPQPSAGKAMSDGDGIVRPFAPEDFEAVYPMLGRCVSASSLGTGFVIERESAEGMRDQLVSGQDAFGYVAEDAKGICGVILAIEAPCLWNATIKAAHVVAWWVEPRSRDTTADVQLLQAVEDRAKRRGAGVILCGGEPWGVDPGLSQRMLGAHGYDVMEPQRFKVL